MGATGPSSGPVVVAHAADRPLSSTLEWRPCQLRPGEDYRLLAVTEGTDETEDIGALVAFDMENREAGGDGLRAGSAFFPPYIYLRTGPGLHRTDRLFTVGSPVHVLGLSAWGDRGPVTLRTLTIERVSTGNVTFFFSFDVEGNPRRSPGSSPIDSLVWGRVGGGEYGISRLCDILEQHGIVGNFLIDFATCAIEGEAKLAAIIDYIASRGHELHLHLHPDRLAPTWGLTIGQGRSIGLDSTAYDMSRRLLDYTVSMFERFAQRPPRVFRSGAYRMNADLVLAAGSVGIESLTNVRRDVVADPMIAGGDLLTDREPFVWDNGVIEIPVDVSSPESGSFEKYLTAYAQTMKRKRSERTYNVVMHSFSLLRRNEHGVHDAFAPEIEDNLHRMCEHALANGRVLGYARYLDETDVVRPVVPIGRIRDERLASPVYVATPDITRCNVCDTPFARSRRPDGRCPSCGLGAEHRSLRYVLDNYGDVFAGRVVLALGADPAVSRRLLRGAAEVRPMDWPAGPLDGPDGSIDAVVGFGAQAGRYSPDLLSDVARVLRPGGVLVAVQPAGDEAAASPEHDLPDLATRAGLSAMVLPGYDPVTRRTSLVVLARPATSTAPS